MKTKNILVLLFLVCASALYSQNKKYVGLELAGTNSVAGLSFDSRFNENSKFGYKVGLGYGFEYHNGGNWYFTPVKPTFPERRRMYNTISVPFNVHYLLGKEKRFLETGLGLCAFYADYENRNNKGLGYYAFGRIAYRHESLTKPILFSIGLDLPFYTPASGLGYSIGCFPSISIGYRL